MKNQIAIAVSLTTLVSFGVQALIAIASGGFSVGSQISEIKSEIKVIRQEIKAQSELVKKDLATQSKHYEYRLSRLEKKK